MTFMVIGICIGIVVATGRVPKVNWTPLAVAFVLLVLAVFGFQEMKLISLSEVLLLLISALLAGALYAGVLWNRENLDPRANAWTWAWREVTNPGFARALFRERLPSADPEDSWRSRDS